MSRIDFLQPSWLILPIAIIAGTIAWLMYRGSKGIMPGWISATLTTFRFLVLCTVGILLLEPSIRSITRQKNPPVIAILQDLSESVGVNKDSTWLKNQYPAALKDFIGKIKNGEVEPRYFGFGEKLVDESDPDSIKFSLDETDISSAIKDIEKLYGNQNLSAVVLLSDGISTKGMNPLYAVQGLKPPVYTVLLGDSSQQKDVQIIEVLHNEIAYLNNETPVKIRVRATGYGNENLKVTLFQGGKTLDTRNISVTPSLNEVEIDFLIKPEKIGVAQYSVTVSSLPGEITTRNNSRLFFINVLENKLKIALFAGYPHPDLGAIHEALVRENRYSVSDFIHKTSSTFYSEPPSSLGDFDLILLHNFPLGSSDATLVSKIITEVKNRSLPVMTFVGQSTDLKTMGPLFDYLGLAPTNSSQTSEEAQINFIPEYSSHSTYTFAEGWDRLMNNAPPLIRNRSEWRAKAETKVFGTARIRNVVLDYPFFALQSNQGKKNMVFVGEGIWRHRSYVYSETGDFEAFDLWLYNNLQWLNVKDDKRKFKVFPSRVLFDAGDPVILKGQVYDDSYNPMTGVEIKVSMKNAEGNDDVYYMKESSKGNYYLEISNLEPGSYSFSAEGKKGEVRIGTDAGKFSIGQTNVEHLRLRADYPLMKQLAYRTNGKLFMPRELDKLAGELNKLSTLKPEIKLKKSRLGLNEFSWIFFLLLGMLAVEWAARKYFSLR